MGTDCTYRSRLAASLAVLLLVGLSPAAHAVDGVLEINQACAANTGCFPGDTAGFPVTITASGSYRLTSNLVVPNVNTDGISVSSPSVSIDLGGFEVVGTACLGATSDCTPASGTGNGITVTTRALRGVSVSNGSVVGMGSNGVWLGSEAEVRRLRARWNRLDGINVFEDSKVSESLAVDNGGDGIEDEDGSKISNCVASGNGGIGIYTHGESTISGNTASDNGFHGVFSSGSSTISGNTANSNNGLAGIGGGGIMVISGNTTNHNSGDGIQASGSISGNTARSNVGAGISGGGVISGNTVSVNGGDGILVTGSSMVARNSVNSNGGNGIEATSGASNIFDNTVTGNTLDGIDCSAGGRSYVRGNSAVENGGLGLDLTDPTRPDAIYRENNIFDNTGGTVSGGNNRGDNSCRNLAGPITDCP